MLEEIIRSHLGQIFALLIAVWVLCTFFFTPVQLIEIENSLLIATGIGVAFAYLENATDALRTRVPTRGGILALGIWLAWIAIAGERIYSLVGRAMGKDITFFNTHLHTAMIALTTLGGVCHLSAPEVIDGKFPRRAWIRLGSAVAGGVFIISLVVWLYGF